MSHAELLAKINPSNTTDQKTYLAPYKALRAVVELHPPDFGAPKENVVCDYCKVIYPCSTIQVIEKELA